MSLKNFRTKPLFLPTSIYRLRHDVCELESMGNLINKIDLKSSVDELVPDLKETIENGVEYRKRKGKGDMYVTISNDTTAVCLKATLEYLQQKYGDQFQMRFFDIENNAVRLQIWWRDWPTKSTVEFLYGHYIKIDDFNIKLWLHQYRSIQKDISAHR